MKNIDIISASTDLGVCIDGADLGAEQLSLLLNNNKIHKIKHIIKNKNYIKNKDIKNLKKNLTEINLFNNELYLSVLNSLNNNSFPIILGGDHSLSIGSSLASIKHTNNLGIIWFDAHGDFNTFKTTTTGNIHGLPFAAITNFEKNHLTDFHTGNYYDPKNCVLLGARDIDFPNELNNLREAGINIISNDDIIKNGFNNMCKKAFNIVSQNTDGIHISFDLDVLDPDLVAPGVSVPVKNGLKESDAFTFINYIIKNKNKINSMDLVEFNPMFDINNKTQKLALKILNTIIDNIN